ncbi:hypothetical protein GGI24_002385, partial [Coemansia furcata]
PEVFGTSIWDYTLYHAWSQIVHRLVPNMSLIERHLSRFRVLTDAAEVVLFERATFLVVCSMTSDKGVPPNKYMTVSQAVKTYRNKCAAVQSTFQSIEIRNKNYSLFVEPFTKSTCILVITSDPEIEPAVTRANIKAAQAHFQDKLLI